MKIVRGFSRANVEDIAKNCGADSVKKSISYIGAPFISGNEGFICETFDDVGFFAGTMCKKHFRLYEIAVKEEAHGNGYGKAMILRIKQLCRENGVQKITLRTSKKETAIFFYRRMGGIIVGEKKGDYEVEIKV